MPSFRFVQLDYGSALGPADGRYLLRDQPDAEPRRVVVLATVAAASRRPRRLRRAREPGPSHPPTARATLIDPAPLGSAEEAAAWLAELGSDTSSLEKAVAGAVRELNEVVRAHRAAASDPFARDISAEGALAVRVGHGIGDEVADGRFADAYEVPLDRRGRSRRRQFHEPQERLARVIGGHEAVPASEELVLRARADHEAGRPREAALQARIALEALLVELEESATGSDAARGSLVEVREDVSGAANAALLGDPSGEAQDRVAEAVRLMTAAVRRRALAEASRR